MLLDPSVEKKAYHFLDGHARTHGFLNHILVGGAIGCVMERGDEIPLKQLLEYDCVIKRAARHAKEHAKLQWNVLYAFAITGVILLFLRMLAIARSTIYALRIHELIVFFLSYMLVAYIAFRDGLRPRPRVFSGVLDLRGNAALEYATFLYRLFERELSLSELTTIMALPVDEHPGF